VVRGPGTWQLQLGCGNAGECVRPPSHGTNLFLVQCGEVIGGGAGCVCLFYAHPGRFRHNHRLGESRWKRCPLQRAGLLPSPPELIVRQRPEVSGGHRPHVLYGCQRLAMGSGLRLVVHSHVLDGTQRRCGGAARCHVRAAQAGSRAGAGVNAAHPSKQAGRHAGKQATVSRQASEQASR